ncbi:MAG: hypothetical protein WC076_03240 [Terrimicrobiaceae bacterium]|jgi:hypothetical protein|nr:hypothetical protein [Terrimicrobiaceae bacterium]
MKTLGIFLLSAALLSALETPGSRENPTARSKVLELAGAFANDGYKIRDGYWSGVLEPGKPQILAVNLFAGNAYWFSAAALAPARKLSVTLFDEKGRPLEGELFQDGSTAAAGLLPDASGRYLVRLELVEGDKADFCLVYSYK